MRRSLSLVAIALSMAIAPPAALADATLIDDFEDVSDWRNLTAETSLVQQGNGAGRWADTVADTSIRKIFAAPLDLSRHTHLGFWLYSEVANGAELQLVLDSDDPATSGWDYYSQELVIDWQGWRWIWLAKDDLGASRQPLGWDQIFEVSLSASGWGHEPLPDTNLVLDQMVMVSAVLERVTQTQSWAGQDFVYAFELHMREPDGAALGVDISCDAPGLTVDIPTPHVDLSANGTATATVNVTIPESVWSAAPYQLHDVTLALVAGGTGREAWPVLVANPGAQSDAPRSLLTADDFTRIADWAGRQSWAADRVDDVIARADTWRADFLADYGLSSFALPPEGGQWGMHYVCPNHGANLRYEPPMTHRCPVDDATWSGWPYDQVIYGRQHNRLADAVRDLGLAYQLTGDAAYAQDAADILLRYAAAYGSYPIHGVDGSASGSGARILAQTLDESGWLIDMAWGYDLVSASGALDPAQQLSVEQDLLRASADTIKRHDAGKSNWQAWHNAAVATAGRAIDDPGLVAFAVNGRSGFHYHMAESVFSDGFWYEGSWGYHFFTVTPMTYLAELGERGGFPLYDDPNLRSMFTSPVLFAPPDLVLPSFNDSGSVDLRGSAQWRMEAAYRAYGDDRLLVPIVGESRRVESLFWGPETVPTEAPTITESLVFGESGFAVMRGGTDTDPWYVALDFGPHGGWHGHFDKLGYVFFARDKLMAIDPGSHSYALPLHDTWDRVTLAHNTVVVDETTQAEATGALERFVALPGLAWSRADAGPVYQGAGLARSLVMVDGYLLDRMEARSLDGQPHAYDWIYHNPAELTHDLAAAPYNGFPTSEGYQHLDNNQAQARDGDAAFTFGFGAGGTYPGGFWASDGAIVASSTYTDADAHGGQWSNALSYDFSAANGAYITFRTRSMADYKVEAPTHVSVWVRGQGSGNELRLRVIDSTGETHASASIPLDFTGWQQVSLEVAGWSTWGGDGNGVIDLPLDNLVAQVNHVAGAPAVGELLLDDWTLVFPTAGSVVVEDYEVLVAREKLWAAGESGSTYVVGEGIGPNLQVPVPYTMIRRSGTDVDFDVLHEPHGAAGPAITAFERLASGGGAHQGYAIASPDFDDVLLLGPGAAAGMATYGGVESDVALAWLRRDTGLLVRFALVDGSQVVDSGTVIFSAPNVIGELALTFSLGTVTIDALLGDLDGARLFAPGTHAVTMLGQDVPFAVDGDWVVFGDVPSWPDVSEGEDVSQADAGTDTSAQPSDVDGRDGASGDLSAETPNDPPSGGSDGCGCRQRTPASQAPWALGGLLVAAVVALRRRRAA